MRQMAYIKPNISISRQFLGSQFSLIEKEKARRGTDSDRNTKQIFKLVKYSTLQRIHRSYSDFYYARPKPAHINNSQVAKETESSNFIIHLTKQTPCYGNLKIFNIKRIDIL